MSATVDKKWIQLQRPSISRISRATKINRHQLIVISRHISWLNTITGKGVAIYDTQKNQWELLAEYPANTGYNSIADFATYNKHKNRVYLAAGTGKPDAISMDNELHELITFDLKTKQFDMNATDADNLWFSGNASVSVNKSIHYFGGLITAKHAVFDTDDNIR